MKKTMRFLVYAMLAGALAFLACDKTKEDNNLYLVLLAGAGSGIPAVPGAATIIAADSQLSLSWSAVAGATAYEVWYNTANDSSTAIQPVYSIGGTSYILKGLTNSTIYYIWLKAKNPAGASAFGPEASGTPSLPAGYKMTFTADGVSFKMVYVPGGVTFPTGTNDSGTAMASNPFWIGETEVTYQLWQKVYAWATTDAGGNMRADCGDLYYFANAGVKGSDGAASKSTQHPATTVNWRDSMVWCNALTEWYNSHMGTNYECTYVYSAAAIRDSRDSNATACDGAVASTTAKGFRLLMSDEYELAARYRDGTLWTYGDHASGDESGACWDDGSILGGLGMSTVFGDYAVYGGNPTTFAVKSKIANALGLYDMGGNVYEWCFDLFESSRVYRGGSWLSGPISLQVGFWYYNYPQDEDNGSGFRVARTQ